ncbi:hypothetical protein DLJ53_08095 [Acuticoccus sediminis]|uniref:Uncharacterized protein n=1 Tax=Acuticoccus sediminis TaxID=2184697 RepID=A0A8B2NW42_9HYPH|nr:hypothetical protein [Acuticoccus sediminis]RAI04388.1 hypothetical protein DLJ53_08095 [Acuticoccus sediminis]
MIFKSTILTAAFGIGLVMVAPEVCAGPRVFVPKAADGTSLGRHGAIVIHGGPMPRPLIVTKQCTEKKIRVWSQRLQRWTYQITTVCTHKPATY